MGLSEHIIARCPGGVSYEDAAQLCLWLHITLEFCPPELREEAYAKERLAEALADVARRGGIRGDWKPLSFGYGANFHQVTDKGHWREVIASIYKKGNTAKREAQARVAEIMGYGADRVR